MQSKDGFKKQGIASSSRQKLMKPMGLAKRFFKSQENIPNSVAGTSKQPQTSRHYQQKEQVPSPDSSSSDEEFVDAQEELPAPSHRSSTSDALALEATVAETQIAMDLFLSNQFHESKRRLQSNRGDSVYHALGYASVLFMKAMMTCDAANIEEAVKATRESCALSDQYRRQSSILTSSVNFLVGANERPFTDEELHAELCFAEALLQRALITFIEDESLASFVRGALKIRTCYRAYVECERLLTVTNWSRRSPMLRRQFEAGIHMGLGTFLLMISALPARIMRLLEFVGFSGNRQLGLQHLKQGAAMDGTVRGPMCSMVLLSWHLIGVYAMGTGEADIPLCRSLVTGLLQLYPNGALSLYYAGRLKMVTGEIQGAIGLFRQSIAAQSEWAAFHDLCHWELTFTHAAVFEWAQSAEYAGELLEQNRWSKCTYAYLKAIYLMADAETTKENSTTSERTTDINRNVTPEAPWHALFLKVPELKQRLAGKSLPTEKFAVVKAQRYLERGHLLFAHHEIMYLTYGFKLIRHDENLVKKISCEVENALTQDNLDADDRCLCVLLKGMCLKHLQSPFQAEECFNSVIESERDLTVAMQWSVAHAWLELALLLLSANRLTECRHCVSKALHTGKATLMELRLNFRCHSLYGRLDAIERNNKTHKKTDRSISTSTPGIVKSNKTRSHSVDDVF